MKGTIKQRSEGSYSLIVDLPRQRGDKRKQKWITFKGTKREAQKELARLITEVDDDTFQEPSKITLAQFFERWLTHMTSQVDERTHIGYAEKARKNITPLLGSTLLTKLRPEQISQAYAQALGRGRRDGKGGLSSRTVHHMHRILKQALGQAVTWGVLKRNPCDAVDPPRVEKKEMKTFDTAQTADALSEMRKTRFLIAYLLAALCGLRRGEIAALRWKNVDLDTGVLKIVQTARQIKTVVSYKPVKNDKGRPVALSSTMVDELRAHRARQAEELLRLGIKLTGDSFVFAQVDGSPIKPGSITNDWVRLVARYKLPKIRLHDLRHTHATAMLGSGIHPKIAQERLGHSSIAITLDLYSHVMPNMQADAIQTMDNELRAAISKQPK
ncbi:tyrosine recombinase XerC [Bradyrhizobium sp. AUGA SZCCT0160]|uniref:site-specific integrase n=1 Tax=Bradyrhizobium sp. AUGA SZCCT0160 TaxID=2807662 RepID=UPI001BA46175|nr:site-specific integrase [Bradyrhizobium sp. AUGA SZCCT0160]MBR1187307.1 tyrosine-type recombinase/integrase [Bradyrhizobium sp. AUGA SZCCT0160]